MICESKKRQTVYYIYHIFAIFDRRLGKRRLIEIVKNVDTEPEWFRKYVIIRAKAEGMI